MGIEDFRKAFGANLHSANERMRYLDDDSMEEMIDAAWDGFGGYLAHFMPLPAPPLEEER